MARKLDEATRAARQGEIARRVAAGESQYQIADALGVSRSLVQKELRSMPEVSRERPAPIPGTRHATNAVPTEGTRAVTSSAIVKDGAAVYGFGGSAMQTILPPPDHFGHWQRQNLDRDTWDKVDPAGLVSLLINVSPDMSRAVWDYLRLLNSGHEITAHKSGTEDPDERAQAALDAFLAKLNGYHGSFKIIAGRLFMAAITRGAFFAELVLDETGRVPIDIATPDPATVRFRRVNDPERGSVWMPGQWQAGRFVDFDSPTIAYIPLDPEPGNPYGRPLIGPAVFPTVFLLGLLHDLRRVVAQQGYPRTKITILLDKLFDIYKRINPNLTAKEFNKLVADEMQGVSGQYARLEPDDAFVSTDAVDVASASGAVDTSVMGGADAVIKAAERMAMRALKSMPLLMGTTDGVSEANANRQWEIFAAGLTTLQHYAETLLGGLLEMALQAQGIAADVEVRFAPVRSADDLRDQQVMKLKLDVADKAEALGYMERDEASEYAVGHQAATDAPVRAAMGSGSRPAAEVQAEPGENRSLTAYTDAELETLADEAMWRSGHFRDDHRDWHTLSQVSREVERRRMMRATSDDVWADPSDNNAVIDEARMRAAMETWEEALAGEPEESLLNAEVEA